MPSVDELFEVAEAAVNETETNDIIEINADTRTMMIPETERVFGVMSDEKGERKYFRCKRFVGNGIDLSKLSLRVIFQNASGLDTGKDKYIVTDLATEGEDYVTFSWELSRKVTAYKGIISFIVCAIKTNTDGTITNEWNTTIANGLVLDGLEVNGTQEQEEVAKDYYNQLEAELLKVASEQKVELEKKAQEVIKTIPNDYTQMQKDVSSLKEDIDVGKETSESEISLIQIKGSHIWNTQQAFTSRNGILYKSDTSNAQYCKVRLEEGVTYKYIGGYPKRSYPALVFAAEGAIGTDRIGREALFYSTDNTEKTLEYTFVKPVDAEYLYINTMYINVSYSPKLYKVEVTKTKIKDVVQNNANRIKKIESNTDLITDKPKIHIGSKIFAVVNDTLQIFKKSIFESVTDSHICKISCQKGKVYPRYFEYTPSSSDVGEMDILFEIYDLKGNTLASKTAKIKTVLASNPSSAKHILCVGDSTTYAGEYPLELSRRLKGTRGVATSPSPLTLSNYNVVGRLNKNGVGWEGTGGWTYSTYNSVGITAVRFHVANASNIGIGDIIQISANNQKGYYRFQVEEVNVTNGNGEIRVMFYQTPHTSTFLSEVSVNGDISNTTSIKVGEYTSLSVETYQPFWNNSQNKFDMESYVTTYCNGKCDYIFILLGINNLIGSNPFGTAYNNIFNDCKILLRNIHSQLPNAKIFLSTNPLVSQNGGIGANYNSNDVSGSFDEKGWNHKIFEMNELYFELEMDSEFTEYVTVVNTHAQFDSDYGYPFTQKPVNTRFSTNEVVGTNAVHPTNQGYWMIADALFRILLSN